MQERKVNKSRIVTLSMKTCTTLRNKDNENIAKHRIKK